MRTDQWGVTRGWETLESCKVVQTWVRIETMSHGFKQRSENPGKVLGQAGIGEGRGAVPGCRVCCCRQQLASAFRVPALVPHPPNLGGAGVL